MNILVSGIPSELFHREPIGIFLFNDQWPPQGEAGRVDFRLAGRLSRWMKENPQELKPDSTLLFATPEQNPFPAVMLAGGGNFKDLNSAKAETTIAELAAAMLKAGYESFGLGLRDLKIPRTPAKTSAEIMLRGLALAAELSGVRSGRTIRLHWDLEEADLLVQELKRFRYSLPLCREWSIKREPQDEQYLKGPPH